MAWSGPCRRWSGRSGQVTSAPAPSGSGYGFAVLRDIWRHRQLVAAFARRDFTTRHRSSALGWLWSIVQPVMMLVVLSVVFAVLFQVQAPPLGTGKTAPYALFLFAGLVVWSLMSRLIHESMVQVQIGSELMRKAAFPRWTPLIAGALIQCLQTVVEIAVLLVLLAAMGNVSWTWLLLIPILLGAACFGQGIGMLLAIWNSRIGDIEHATGVVLSLLYFLTPVVYSVSMVEGTPAALRWAILANPFSWYVTAAREATCSLGVPPIGVLVALVVGGLVMFAIGFRYFVRHEDSLIDAS